MYFIKTETDPLGGTAYTLSSISQLLSVPYALVSNNGISRISEFGDSLVLTNGKSVIIPGLSAANPKANPTSGYGPNITDVDGNSYKTVYIGQQQWMGENLKVSKYSDGTTIGAWTYYNNDVTKNAKYGKLYNWDAVSKTTNGNKNICPTGWHVPTDAEWTVLTDYLGGASVAGGKMKEVGTTNWTSPNVDATNVSLFTGLPGGYRNVNGNYYSIGTYGYWWSSTEDGKSSAWFRVLNFDYGSVSRSDGYEGSGFSVRCIRD
jgi:uncharacterized protein (TIGR02145 family)